MNTYLNWFNCRVYAYATILESYDHHKILKSKLALCMVGSSWGVCLFSMFNNFELVSGVYKVARDCGGSLPVRQVLPTVWGSRQPVREALWTVWGSRQPVCEALSTVWGSRQPVREALEAQLATQRCWPTLAARNADALRPETNNNYW